MFTLFTSLFENPSVRVQCSSRSRIDGSLRHPCSTGKGRRPLSRRLARSSEAHLYGGTSNHWYLIGWLSSSSYSKHRLGYLSGIVRKALSLNCLQLERFRNRRLAVGLQPNSDYRELDDNRNRDEFREWPSTVKPPYLSREASRPSVSLRDS